MSRLSDKTLIPLGIAVLAIGGSAMWLTTLYMATEANGRDIQEVKVNYSNAEKMLQRMDRRILQIQLKLGIQPEQGDN